MSTHQPDNSEFSSKFGGLDTKSWGSQVQILGSMLQNLGVRFPNLGVPGTDVGIPAPDIEVQGPSLMVPWQELRVLIPNQGPTLGGFRISGSDRRLQAPPMSGCRPRVSGSNGAAGFVARRGDCPRKRGSAVAGRGAAGQL